MKTIKIFAIPSHQSKNRTSGVDFARIIQPMKALNGFELDGTKFKVDILDPESKISGYDVGKKYDVVFMNYISNSWGFAEIGAMVRHFGKKIVFDVDDSLWNIMPDNPAYDVWKKGSSGIREFTAMCNEVDYMTCTSEYLRNVIIHNTTKYQNKIAIMPNWIDLSLYKYTPEFRNQPDIKLTHFGSTTHFIDLQNKEFIKGVDKIMKLYPNVSFNTVGAFVPQFRYLWGQRYVNSFGHQDIYQWINTRFPDFMKETDIMLVPLENSVYTRCKSEIKFLEAASAKRTGVYQRIRQYEAIVDGTNGLLAESASEWFEAIKKLIDDKEFRRQAGENAYKTILGHQMKDHVIEYAKFFKSIL